MMILQRLTAYYQEMRGELFHETEKQCVRILNTSDRLEFLFEMP